MAELENQENIKSTIQDTQMLIRNHMQHHKKLSKQLHSQILKDKKTIALYKEKINQLASEKENLEEKQTSKNENEQLDPPDIKNLKDQIIREIAEKKEYDEKIDEIKSDFLTIKNDMGGLNATQQSQARYEKHIRILENRLDKANQKFNDSIEYDKKLRAEIDKLRKERFFFENIYKKLEKDLEKVRKEISKNLEDAYDNYEQRDVNQENFENLTAEMVKQEAEYGNILSRIANDLDIRNSRKKSIERKDIKSIKMDNTDNLKNYSKKIKSEQYEQQQENLNEKYQNLKYKFEKLEEFTEQKDVGSFCEKFKKNSQKNFDLFVAISMMSSEAKKLESEIKEIEEEMNTLKKNKNSQQGLSRQSLVSEIKTKMDKLIQVRDKCEQETLKFNEEFTQVKNHIKSLFKCLECDVDLNDEENILFSKEPNENNILPMLAKIEARLKWNQKILEFEKTQNDEDYERISPIKIERGKLNPRLVNENMKKAFNSMDIGKIKSMEKLKSDHKTEDFKFDNLKVYSEKVADELMDNVLRENQNEKKQQNKMAKKYKKYQMN